MAKKTKLKEPEVFIPRVKELTDKEVHDLAKEKGYEGSEKLSSLEDWLRYKHGLYTEIFYSFFHNKWSINGYFIHVSEKVTKIERNAKLIQYFTHKEALRQALYEMLKLI